MARFYRIQINSIYLTSDGTSGGIPCKLQVVGVEDLLTEIIGTAVLSVGGTPVYQLVPFTTGKSFEIQIETINQAEWDDLKDLLNLNLTNDSSVSVTGTGEIGDFIVAAKPNPVKPFAAGSFLNGRILGATLRFITV